MRNYVILTLILFSLNALAGTGGSSSGMERPANPSALSMGGMVVGLGKGVNVGSMPELLRQSNGMIRLQTNNVIEVESLELNECDKQTLDICSVIQPSIPTDYMDFLFSYSTYIPLKQQPAGIPGASPTASNCNCIRDKLIQNKDARTFAAEQEQKKKEVNEKILNAFGQKFVNDYSSNIEDVSFFLTQTSTMFTDDEYGKSLQCNNQAAYNEKITEVCSGKGITDQVFIQARKNKFINVLTGQDIPFESRLDVMSREIMGANVTSELKGSTGHVYARKSYDTLRLGLATDEPAANFVDAFMTKVLKNSSFRSKIEANFVGDKSPVEAIMKVISDYRGKPEFDELGLSAADINTFIKDQATTVDTFKFMMQVHPGFMHAMKDKRVFNNLSNGYVNFPNFGLRDLLAKDKSILEPVLTANCQKMISDFANAVCVKDEDLVANMEATDLSRLLKASEPKTPQGQLVGLNMNDLLICEAKISSINPDQKFQNLANLFDTRLRSTSSDYYQRQLARSRGQEANDAFSNTASLGATSKGQKILSRLIDRGRELSRSVNGVGVVSDQVYAENIVSGRDLKVGSGSMSQSEAKKYLAESRAVEENKLAQKSGTNASSEVVASEAPRASINPGIQNVAAGTQNLAGPQYVSNASASDTAAQAREALRDYIADKNNETEVDRAIGGIDDPTTIELNRLRAENESLLERSLREETLKFEELKTKLAKLQEDQKNSPAADVTPNRVPASDNRPVRPNLDSLRQSFTAPQNQVQNPVNRNVSSSAGNANFSGSSTVSKAGVSSDVESSSGRGRRGDNQFSSGLTLTSTSVQPSDVQVKEVNQEVRKLLENPETNIASLEDIKTKGFVYRFTTVENNQVVQKEIVVKYESLDKVTKDALEIRLTKKAVDNQLSKLAVLRMLIKQNQRF